MKRARLAMGSVGQMAGLMARKLRLEFAGACYHVLNRGNYKRDLFAPAGAADSFYHCRDEKFSHLARRWAIGSAAFRAELRLKLREATEQLEHFELLGADREAVREARVEWWEDRLRTLAAASDIDLKELPRKKSAIEKLTLAAAMKRTTSVSLAWLAQRLQMGATDSVASLLTRFRAAGGMETAAFKAIIVQRQLESVVGAN